MGVVAHDNVESPGLELPPGISPALVTLVPGTAVAKDIPAGDTDKQTVTDISTLCLIACVEITTND